MAGFSYAASVPPPHSHQSGEVSMASFCPVPSATSAWPCSLRALEEQNFLFQLQAPEQPPDSTKEVRFPLPSPGSGAPSLPAPPAAQSGRGRQAGGSCSFCPGTCRAWRFLLLRWCSGRPPSCPSQAASTRTTGERPLFQAGQDTQLAPDCPGGGGRAPWPVWQGRTRQPQSPTWWD